jgi:HTH-type transcriptional regulator/antitoxin MqsA
MSETFLICPVCESGPLQPHRYRDTFQHQGKNLVVDDLEGYRCAECGADPVFEDQICRNHARISDARRQLPRRDIWKR